MLRPITRRALHALTLKTRLRELLASVGNRTRARGKPAVVGEVDGCVAGIDASSITADILDLLHFTTFLPVNAT